MWFIDRVQLTPSSALLEFARLPEANSSNSPDDHNWRRVACAYLKPKSLSELGIKERRVGNVTILDSDALLRIKLRFGRSSVTLATATTSLLAVGQNQILLSLEGVSSISANGLGELVSAYVLVKNGGGHFKLVNLSPTVQQLLQATNLSAVFDLYEDEADALSSFTDRNSSSASHAARNQARSTRETPTQDNTIKGDL